MLTSPSAPKSAITSSPGSISRFGTSAGRDDLSGFNGETKSGYFLDEPKQGVPWIAEDIRTDAVVNPPTASMVALC